MCHTLRQKLRHNESGEDNGRVYGWRGEIEGAAMIQAHQARIHPRTPAGFHRDGSAFLCVGDGSAADANGTWGQGYALATQSAAL